MDRRTFGKLAGMGAVGAFSGSGSAEAKQTTSSAGAGEAFPQPNTTAEIPKRPVEWPSRTFRRLLIDTHVPDWDDLLGDFNAANNVATIAGAGFQSYMAYANSHVGLCLWRTQIGQMHRGMRGRDYFGEVMEACHRHGLHRVAYYSLVFDDWAYRTHPDWRILPEQGYDPQLFSRNGTVCINSPYRSHALACLKELVGNYDFEGIFLDMTFWPAVCYCPHCTERFWKEAKNEPPRIVNWKDPLWRTFQKSRETWMREFALEVTQTIKSTRSVQVYHQYSTAFHPWVSAVSLEQNEASDSCSGDFYGGAAQFSLVAKTYYGLTRTRPFEFMTSRTTNLNDFEATKPFEQLLLESLVPTVHSAATLLIDALKPMGTLDTRAYEFMSQVNARHDPYEPFLGGEMQADIAIYYDKASLYDPDVTGPAATVAPIFAYWGHPLPNSVPPPSLDKMRLPHMDAVVGMARILRQAHIPFGVVTNANLDQLKNFRAVAVPNVLEMTPQQADQFREFVRNGGVLYASGPSSLAIADRESPRFLLEDVLGIRYLGHVGDAMSYLSVQDPTIEELIWPQEHLGFPGSMIKAESLPDAEVLATITLPLVAVDVGDTINTHFAQIWSNPPAASPGKDPGIVVNSFGKGKAIWIAAPMESQTAPVDAAMIAHLLRTTLPGPYKFEAETHPAVEMTLFDQQDKNRMLVGLLNMQEQIPTVPVGATVRVHLDAGRTAKRVLLLPEQEEIRFVKAGPYVQFKLPPFDIVAMALVEYM